MLDLRNVTAGRQQVIEVAAPAGWVLTTSIISNRGPIEHAFDPSAQARRRLRLGVPDGLECFQDQADVYRCDGQVSKVRVGIGLQRRGPLRRMLAFFQAEL